MIQYHHNDHYSDTKNVKHWDFLLTNFDAQPENVWVRNPPEEYTGQYDQLFDIEKIDNLPVIILTS